MTRKKRRGKVKLLREVVFPVGEEGHITPYVSRVTLIDTVSVLIALDKAATAELIMMREDAERLGYIEEGP